MKLRQKLAVVLASAMVVTAVPVVTMAASTNSLHKATLKVKKDTEFFTQTSGNALRIRFNYIQEKETFYLKLENAEFLSQAKLDECLAVAGMDNVKYDRQDDKTVKVTFNSGIKNETVDQLFPIFAKVTGGDAKVILDTQNGDTTLIANEESFIFATTAEKVFTATVGDATTFYTDASKIAEITLKEAYKGALASQSDQVAVFALELDDTDFKFYGYGEVEDEKSSTGWTKLSSSDFDLKYGFSGQTIDVYVATDKDDAGKLYVKVDGSVSKQDSLGQIILKNIKVKSSVKNPESGDLLVDIKSISDSLTEDKNNQKVAVISEYGVALAMKDDKAKEIVAGNIEEIQFDIKEAVENSMISGRTFTMTLDKGHWDYKGMYKLATGNDKPADQDNDKDVDDDDFKKALAKLSDDEKVKLAKELIDNDGDWVIENGNANSVRMEFDVDNDNKAIVDTIIVTVGYGKNKTEVQKNNETDKMTIKAKVCVPIGDKAEESVKLTVKGRALENDAETTAVTIKNPVDITTEAATLKVGLQDQKAGKITLTETDKEMFQKGGTITLQIKDCPAGLKLDADASIETAGGIKNVKVETNKDNKLVTLTINRSSKEASSITVPALTFTVDRTVPEGSYDLEIGGTALDDDGHTITIKDFVIIGTKNSEELNATNGLAKGTATFAIGESKYTLNGVEKTMDGAASYIQDPGYTMVPVRYVAQAFGVSDADILFGKGTVTIFAGNRTVQLTSGSDVAIVNGAPVAMATKVVIKEGRTYAPIGEIAKILGVGSTWDNDTKTATFKN